MSLVFFEGFDNCSSFKDVSGIFKIGCSMLDDPRTINPILSSGSVGSISAKNSGNMLVLQSSYGIPSSGSTLTVDLNSARRVLSTNVSIPLDILGSGTLSSPFTFGKNPTSTTNTTFYGDLPNITVNRNGNFNFTALQLIGVYDPQTDNDVVNFQIFRTRNGARETVSTSNSNGGSVDYTGPVKSGDIISFSPKSSSTFSYITSPTFWATESTGVFFPSVSIDLTKNLTKGVIGFGYAPTLPTSGSFGDGVENFTPIACLTDSLYRPHLFICTTNSGKVQLRKFNAANFVASESLNSFYNYSLIDSAKTEGSSQIYPRFLKSTTDPSLSIGGSGTNLTLVAESSGDTNTLVNNFWNYIELKFDMETQDAFLRINRRNTSTTNDLAFNGTNINTINLANNSNNITVLSGVFSGSGTYNTPYTGAISNSGIFRANLVGNINLVFTAAWNSSSTPNRAASFFKNGSLLETISLPNQGFATTSSVNYNLNIPVVSGDVFGFTYNSLSPTITAYFIPSSSLSDQFDKRVRHLVLGTMWGQNTNGVSPASNLGWNTLLDDIYAIDTSDATLPNDFIGSVSCRRIPFNQQISNTAASGSLASVSDILSGSGGFTTPSGNGTLFFDAINQEFNVKSSGFSVNNNNIIALQVSMNGFSLNTEDYIGVGLELQNNSGSYNFSPVVLSKDSINGSYSRGQLYATDPSGVNWTEEKVQNTIFKLKTFSG